MATGSTADRVTLAAVAQEAGVSLSTISKVLNGRSDVSAPTRSRVEDLLARHGYERRRARAETRREFLELVVHELESSWTMELISGVESVAAESGLSVVLTVSGSRHAPADDWIEGVMRRRPVGVVLVFSDLARTYRERLRSRAIPFVVVDPAGDPAPDVPSVGSTNWSGGVTATRHLVELGHRRIAAITGPADMMCSLARLDGYRSAMGAAALPVDERWVRYGDFHTEGGLREARALLALPERPTAVFAGSDLQALGVMDAARSQGLRVPQDLSVVGYDDIPLARWLTPRLTTVHQPLRRMGEEAARLMLTWDDQPRQAPRVELATSLAVRESTAPPAD